MWMANTNLILSDKLAEDLIYWLYAVADLLSCFCSQFILMVCAIYWLRFRDTSSSCDASSKRYVITNPPDDFSLLPTDQVSYSCSYNLYPLSFRHAGLSYNKSTSFSLCFHMHSFCTCSFPILFCIFPSLDLCTKLLASSVLFIWHFHLWCCKRNHIGYPCIIYGHIIVSFISQTFLVVLILFLDDDTDVLQTFLRSLLSPSSR
jgi:hypothetical protein